MVVWGKGLEKYTNRSSFSIYFQIVSNATSEFQKTQKWDKIIQFYEKSYIYSHFMTFLNIVWITLPGIPR